MLEYDNSAFYYFALTLLVIYILPGTWYALSEFIYAFVGSGEIGSKARTLLEKDKAKKLKEDTTGFTRLNKTSYIVNLVFLVIAWFLLIYLITLVRNDGEVNTFDPYQILGIESGSTVGEIKKAYRRLSLRYHPDKNIGDKIAEEMFMKIAKAYESLTDETSKENYEKYGNPDGKQALEVSIGLPSIILENPKVVLVLYLIAMVVVIPSAVGLWYANSKQFGEKNIKYNTYNVFYQLLLEAHRLKNFPEVIAASAEFRTINDTTAKKLGSGSTEEQEIMAVLYAKMKTEKLMVKPKHEDALILRGNLLLHAHLLRLTSSLTKVFLIFYFVYLFIYIVYYFFTHLLLLLLFVDYF
jgi:translocation protein SEC63